MARRASLTAEAVCFFRAAEVWSEPRVLDDPHALSMLSPALRNVARSKRLCSLLLGHGPADLVRTWVALRHRALDDVLLRFVASGGRSVVVVGAGFDTRALRFADTNIEVTEIDLPQSQARKKKRLGDAARHVRFVPLEIGPGGIGSTLGTRAEPTLILWEGVSMYLRSEVVRAALAEMRASVPVGSMLAWDFCAPAVRFFDKITFALGGVSLGLLGEPLRYMPEPREVESILDATGWELESMRDGAVLSRELCGGARAALPHNYVVVAKA